MDIMGGKSRKGGTVSRKLVEQLMANRGKRDKGAGSVGRGCGQNRRTDTGLGFAEGEKDEQVSGNAKSVESGA